MVFLSRVCLARLFSVVINSIVTYVQSPVHYSLYVDDLSIYGVTRDMAKADETLQLVINELCSGTIFTGFKFAVAKTEHIAFSCHR